MQHINNGDNISETVVLFEETHRSIKDYVDLSILEQSDRCQDLNDNLEVRINNFYNIFEVHNKQNSIESKLISSDFLQFKNSTNISLYQIKNDLRDSLLILRNKLKESHNNLHNDLLLNKELIEINKSSIKCIENNLADMHCNSSNFMSVYNLDNEKVISELRKDVNSLIEEIIILKTPVQKKKGFFRRLFRNGK